MSLRSICQFWKHRPVLNAHPLIRGTVQQPSLRHFCSHPHIVQMRGLDYETKEQDVIEFFKPLGITPKAIYLKCDATGRTSAISEVEFATHAEAVVAMRKKNAFMGNRFIRLTLKSSEAIVDSSKEAENKIKNVNASPEAKESEYMNRSPIPPGYTVKMKNAPWRLSDDAIFEFFHPIGANPISVKPIYNESGIRTGEFDVQFLTKEDAIIAMVKNNAYLGNRFVELSLQDS